MSTVDGDDDLPEDDQDDALLASLGELAEPRQPDFRKQVRRAIYQREVASEMGGLSWSGLVGVVLEYVGALLSFFHPTDGEKGQEDEWKPR